MSAQTEWKTRRLYQRIAELEMRVGALEAALRPFADYFSPGMERVSPEHEITPSSPWAGRALTVGDVRRAKTALQERPNGKDRLF